MGFYSYLVYEHAHLASSNGYLYEFDLYLGKKQNINVILGEDVVMQISENLKDTFCTLFSDNFFNSSLLINKLFEENFYAVGTVRSNRKHMRKLQNGIKIVRRDLDFQFSKMSFAANGLVINLPFY